MSCECGGSGGELGRVLDRLSGGLNRDLNRVKAFAVFVRGHVTLGSNLVETVGECHDTERIVFDGDDLVGDSGALRQVAADLNSSSDWKRVDEFSPPLRIQLANQSVTVTDREHLVVLVGQKLVWRSTDKRERADRRKFGKNSLVHGFGKKGVCSSRVTKLVNFLSS